MTNVWEVITNMSDAIMRLAKSNVMIVERIDNDHESMHRLASELASQEARITSLENILLNKMVGQG